MKIMMIVLCLATFQATACDMQEIREKVTEAANLSREAAQLAYASQSRFFTEEEQHERAFAAVKDTARARDILFNVEYLLEQCEDE